MLPVPVKFSLKDDDSGDHDQDQGSPKDSEKEKNEDEDKEQSISKKKVIILLKSDSCVYRSLQVNCRELSHCLVYYRWWCRGQESILFNTTTPSGTPDAPQGDQPVLRATNRTLNRLAASPRYVDLRDLTQADIASVRHKPDLRI